MWRMQVKVLGAERQRLWSYDEKVCLVEEILQAGETVCGVGPTTADHCPSERGGKDQPASLI